MCCFVGMFVLVFVLLLLLVVWVGVSLLVDDVGMMLDGYC